MKRVKELNEKNRQALILKLDKTEVEEMKALVKNLPTLQDIKDMRNTLADDVANF
jgi:hypothetical protein